jgi:hypothetical protein
MEKINKSPKLRVKIKLKRIKKLQIIIKKKLIKILLMLIKLFRCRKRKFKMTSYNLAKNRAIFSHNYSFRKISPKLIFQDFHFLNLHNSQKSSVVIVMNIIVIFIKHFIVLKTLMILLIKMARNKIIKVNIKEKENYNKNINKC